MHTKTIAELAKVLRKKEISSVELTQHFLERIKTYDPLINSFITVTSERALNDAKKADEAKKVLNSVISKIQRAGLKGVIKKNTASRKISRLMKRLKELSKA